MPIKKNFAVSVLDFNMIGEVNKIIPEYAEITMRSSSYLIFDKMPANLNDLPYDITIFQLEAEDEASLKIKLNDLIEDLNKVNTDYALRDQDTGELLVYVEFVGILDIKFDNIKAIKPETYEKIDELKDLKTELGICKGFKPDFRPIGSKSVENTYIKPESIYFYCHTQENLLKLKDLLSEKIMEINPDFEIDFKQYSESDLY